MSVTGDGGTLLDAPNCVPARYSLLSVAEVEDRPDGHWQGGAEYFVESCEPLFVVQACPALPEDKSGHADHGGSYELLDPFTVIANYRCSTGNGNVLDEAWDLAQTRLERGESRILEQTFWSGKDVQGEAIRASLGNDPDAVDVTPVPGTAVGLTDGLALLEEWAGTNYPCSPVIHGHRGVGTYLAERNLVSSEGSVLLCRGTGSRVVVGGGYGSSGPQGVAAAAGTAWMFVTGSLKVVRGPIFFTPPRGSNGGALDRTTNDVHVFAERTYGFEKDCITAAVLVDLNSCC